MKKVLFFLLFPLCAFAQIVNNSGSTPADSISIPFFALDSVGDMCGLAAGDTVHITVFYPSGGLAYRDSAAYNGTKITSQSFDNNNCSTYTWKEAVATIDGTPVQGVYSYLLVVSDNSGADLKTPHRGQFHLITETDFNTTLEYVKDILDTLQNHDNWVATSANQTLIIDTVNGIIDTLQNQDDWVASATELTNAIDSINAILDTLQLYDGRYALEASVTAMRDSLQYLITADLTDAVDSINAILDTLQLYDGRYALEASLTAVRDSLQYLVTATGFATTSDSMLVKNRGEMAGEFADSVVNDKRIIDMASALGMMPSGDTDAVATRYVSLSGDNTDGRTWETAWDNFDSVNYWCGLDNRGDWDKIMIYLAPDSFTNVFCSVWTDNTHLIGSGWDTWVQGKTYFGCDTSSDNSYLAAYPDSSDMDAIRIFGNHCGVYNMTVTGYDTVGNPEGGDPATGGNNAITFDVLIDATPDSFVANYGTVRGCYLTGHKPLQTNPRDALAHYGMVFTDNYISDFKQVGIDVGCRNSIISNNYVVGAGGFWNGAIGISIYNWSTAHAHSNLITHNKITAVNVGIGLINSDSNMVIDNSFGYVNVPVTTSEDYTKNVISPNNTPIELVPEDNILANGGFEYFTDMFAPYGWVFNGSSAGINDSGGRAQVYYGSAYSGSYVAFLAPEVSAAQRVVIFPTTIANSTEYTVTINSDATPTSWTSPASGTTGGMICDSLTEYINSDADISDSVTASDSTTLVSVIHDVRGNDYTISTSANLDTNKRVTAYSSSNTTASLTSRGYYLQRGSYTVEAQAKRYLSVATTVSFSAWHDIASDTSIHSAAWSLTNDNYNKVGTDFEVLEDGYYYLVFTAWGTHIYQLDDIVLRVMAYDVRGRGDNQVIVYAVDTSGTDAVVSGVKLTISGPGDAEWIQRTGSGGADTFNLDDGAYTVLGSKTGYIFPSYTPTYTTDSTDTLKGYDITVGTPDDAELCRVHGYFRKANDGKVRGVVVAAEPIGKNLADTAGVGVIVSPIPVEAPRSDSLGYFYIDLRKSVEYGGDTTLYNIVGMLGEKTVFRINRVFVPDAESFNLADTLAGR